MIGILFDVFSLQAAGVYTTQTDVYSAPARQLDAEKLANADGSVVVNDSLQSKVFTCEGYMVADTVSDLDELIDTFKTNLNKRDGNFDIDYASSIRRYVATPRNITISRPKGLNTAGWSVEFFCANPVGSDIAESTLLAATIITSSSSIAAMTIAGSYIAEPVITVTITAVTGGTTNKSISISNDTTLRGITVTRDWIVGDVLEIDCLNKTLYVNNTVVDYTGQFLKWDPGNSGLSYLDDFTTRSVTLSAVYYRRFI